MSDEQKKANEEQKNEAKQAETKSVDYSAQLKDKDSEIKKLRDELDNAKLSLLDPDYISFRNSKKSTEAAKIVNKEMKEGGKMTEDRYSALEEKLNKLGTTLQNVLASMELQTVESKYKDFDQIREEVAKVLETSSTPLTIEQAYKIAKQNVREEKDEQEKKTDAKAASEKPSTKVPDEETSKKTFKDKKEAAEDAWEKAVGKGKDTI